MNNSFTAHFRTGAGPAREQNLFIGFSKHLYLLRDGTVKHQRKDIDHRLPGAKTLLTRFVLLDVDTGTLYGEYHDDNSSGDLLGFLTRAWSKKANHPMRGFPKKLNIPRTITSNSSHENALKLVHSYNAAMQIGDLPSGFEAGVHAVKQFEREIVKQVYDINYRRGEPPDIFMIQALSGVISSKASNSMAYSWADKWELVKGLPDSFYHAVDAEYEMPGAWREGAFDLVINGSGRNAARV